jgi:S-DNA-T family DNA segregation ATPase FtsK/SpoIIIE
MNESIDLALSENQFQLAKSFLIDKQVVSVSSLQRRLKIGYNRALALMDELEKCGVVTGLDSTGTRKLAAPFLHGSPH